MKSLIVFYSLEGNTKLIAQFIQEFTNAEILELKPKKEIPKKGFLKFIWGGKSVMFKEKPILINKRNNIDDYELLFIGTPVWSGTFAPAINSFLFETKITGKKIALFSCHSGGGDKKCVENFTKMLNANNVILSKIDFVDPLKADNQVIRGAVEDWLKQLGVKE